LKFSLELFKNTIILKKSEYASRFYSIFNRLLLGAITFPNVENSNFHNILKKRIFRKIRNKNDYHLHKLVFHSFDK